LVLHQEPARPRSLVPGIPRDLETICIKCLQKEPLKRYRTAGELAADLRAYLEVRPIAARPVGAAERAFKWAKRRPGGAAALAASVLVVVAFIVLAAAFNERLRDERNTAVRERDKAEEQRAEAERQRQQALSNFRLARRAVDTYSKKIAEDPRLWGFGLEEVRKEWLQAGEEFYREFAKQYGNDPTIDAERARAYAQLADITAGSGSPAEAAELFRQAREIQERLIEEPDVAEHRFDLSNTLVSQGGALRHRSQYPEARALYERALALRVKLAADVPNDGRFQMAVAAMWNNLGLLHKDANAAGPAEEAFKTAASRIEAIPAGLLSAAEERDGKAMYALVYVNLGGVYTNAERYDEAEKVLKKGLDLQIKDPGGLASSRDRTAALGLTRVALAFLYTKTNREKLAEEQFREALELLEPLAAKYPTVLDYQNVAAASRMTLGILSLNAGRPQDAEKAFQKGVEVLEPLTKLDPTKTQYQTNLYSARVALAQLHGSSGRAELAEPGLRAALAITERLLAAEPNHPDYLEKRAQCLCVLGQVFNATRRQPEAETEFRKALAIREQLVRDHPAVTSHVVETGRTLTALGASLARTRTTEALELYNRSETTLRTALAKEPKNADTASYLREVHFRRAGLLGRLGRHAEAIADRKRVVAHNEALAECERTPENVRGLAGALDWLGDQYKSAGQPKEAITAYRKAADRYAELLKDKPDSPDDQLALAAIHGALGLLLADGRDAAAADTAYREAIRHYEAVRKAHPNEFGNATELAGNYCNLAHLLRTTTPADALPWYTKAVGTLRAVLDERTTPEGTKTTARRYLRNSYSGRAAALDKLGRPEEAAADQKAVVALYEQSAAKDSAARREHADAAEYLGDLYRQAKQPKEAAPAFEKAAVLLEAVADADKENPMPRLKLAGVLEKLGEVHGSARETAKSIPHWEKAVALRERLAKEFPDAVENLAPLAKTYGLIGMAQFLDSRPEKAAERLRASADVWKRLLRLRERSREYRVALAEALSLLGLVHSEGGDHKKAEAVLAQAAETWQPLIDVLSEQALLPYREKIADCFAALGAARLRLENTARAIDPLHRAVEQREELVRNDPNDPARVVELGGALSNLALAIAQDDRAASLEHSDRAVVTLEAVLKKDRANAGAKQYLGNALRVRAESLGKLKRYKDALADWDRVVELKDGIAKVSARISRGLVLARHGKHAKAVTEAEALLKGERNGGRLYNLACTLSLSASAAGGAPGEKCAARAVEVLTQLHEADYFRAPAKIKHMKADPDLDPLRERADYRSLVAKLDSIKPAPERAPPRPVRP
jgi:tetratricopeptide (TPR) repeat protein